MNIHNLCRCCLSEGTHKGLNDTHLWLNKKEVYSEMLNECFNVILSESSMSAGICDVCIKLLRDSFVFKQQVLKSEQEFLKRIEDFHDDSKLTEVKLEPKQEESDNDSDDYFLADTAREMTIPKINVKKEDAEMPRKKPVKSRSKTQGNKSDNVWRSVKIKTIVNKLATSINSVDLPPLSMKPQSESKLRTRKITIKQSKEQYQPTRLQVKWASRVQHEKFKHKENLQTILKYSNATPFKNKSLLGFVCGYCTSTFPDPTDLRSHTLSDHSSNRLDFPSTADLTEYAIKLDITDLKCTICAQNFNDLTSLRQHLVKNHEKTIHCDVKDFILQFKLKKGEVYDCAMCTSTYETFKMLKQHMNSHYKNYDCVKCEASFATKRSLNAHLTTHEKGNFQCDFCEKIFSNKTKKQSHMKMKHLGAKNIGNCPFCNEGFKSYYQRNQHLVKVHNSEARYKCNVCAKSYILKSLLMSHIKKSHLMEKNHQCTECGFRFFSKKALKAHMIKHTGERVHACSVCGKAYARKYTLREHMRIHDNDRRFRCDVCSMTFVQKCSLKSHLLSNHGISMAASDITTI